MGKLVHHHLYFPTTYTEEGLVGKLRKTSAGYTPLTASGFPTTYREEGLVGKLSSTSPPPIQKRGSWGSCLKDVRRLSPLCHSAALARRGRGRLRGRRCVRPRPWGRRRPAAYCARARDWGRGREPGLHAERRALLDAPVGTQGATACGIAPPEDSCSTVQCRARTGGASFRFEL